MPARKIRIANRQVLLDARPDRLDLRDLPYRPRLLPLPEVHPSTAQLKRFLPGYRKAGLVLDQGEEGACTGFGLAAVINYQLWLRALERDQAVTGVSPFMLYQLARFYDEWQGEDYEGSSCRGALKGWQRHGVCAQDLWPHAGARPLEGWDEDALRRPLGVYYRIEIQSVVDLQAAIVETGAVYVSADVHGGWDLGSAPQRQAITHDNLPVIPRRRASGAHAFALVGYNARGFVVQNSWGEDWGAGGFAVLPYEDWVANGSDAWAVALGAPVAHGAGARGARSPRHFVRSAPSAVSAAGRRAWLGDTPREDQESRQRWSVERAYAHTLVTGNDGRVINRLPHIPSAEDSVRYVCRDQPTAWIRQRGQHRKLVVYAHGGLNSEQASIERNRVLGRLFLANGIYPLFTTWRSGPFETIGSLLADHLKSVLGGRLAPATGLGEFISERTDRLLEGACRHLLVKAMWSEMKENVARGQQQGRGLDAIAAELHGLQQAHGIEVHLVGHSAGAYVCGRLLQELGALGARVTSCTLYAPACDVAFANEFFAGAVSAGVLPREAFDIHLLSDAREQDDSVGGVYRKSLLYLVSRALESVHKTPILGLESVFLRRRATTEHWHTDTLPTLRTWQDFWGTAGGTHLHVLEAKEVETVKGEKRERASHGCFDNSLDIVNATLVRTTGKRRLDEPAEDLDY